MSGPLLPAAIAGGVERTQVRAAADGIRWLEHRYDEARACVMHAAPGQPPRQLTPPGVDVGSLVWEYGGGCHLAVEGAVVYADRDDQRLYRLDPGGAPWPLTPAPALARGERYADGSSAPGGRWAAYVRESHVPGGPVRHAIVAVALARASEPRVLTCGRDFYAAPRVSPDGGRLAWLCWDKPNMPWDGSELWVASLDRDGTPGSARRVAGGRAESVLAPSWSPDGVLHWLSDRSGWWNLEALDEDGGGVRALAPQAADFAAAPWHHGLTSYGFLADGTIAAVRIRDAIHELVRIDPANGATTPLGPPLTAIEGPTLSCHGDTVALIGASATGEGAVFALDARGERVATVAADEPPHADARAPEPLPIARSDGGAAHAFLHRPAGAAPAPLVLDLHGGPTDHARCTVDGERLLWTTRGFAVAQLNYSGSSGFGRVERERLQGRWGEADLADCVATVRLLVAEGVADARRVLVRGGSAGGYLTLQCLTATTLFAGGMARSAIADLALWRDHTHDFESRYTDLLVGPPGSDGYAERSPARHVGPRSAPALLVHGTADPVVPPQQARVAAHAYRRAGREHRLVLLDDEPHDFRSAAGRRRQLEAEVAFAARMTADGGG